MNRRLIVLLGDMQRKVVPSVVTGFVLLGFFLPGCGPLPEAETPAKRTTVMFKPNELKELPPVHLIHRGNQLTEEMEPEPEELECPICHKGEVSSHKKERPAMSVCFGCHKGQNPLAPELDCKDCHLGTTKVFAGIGGIVVEETESLMADVDCTDCHDSENEYKVSPDICSDCHEEPEFEIKSLQKKHDDKAAAIEKHYKVISDYAKSAQGSRKLLINPDEFKRGEYYYKLASLDRSRGIHNAEFILQLMNEAEKILPKLSKHYKEKMERLLRDGQSEYINIRLMAIENLGEIGGKTAREFLIKTLQDPAPGVRKKVVEVLGKIKGEKPLAELIGILQQDTDSGVRQKAVLVLGEIGGKKVMKALTKATKDNNFGVRYSAETVLKKLKNPDVENKNSFKKWDLK